MLNNEYWAERQAKAQDNVTEKNIKDIEKQLAKDYRRTMESVIKEFELTYKTYLLNLEKGVPSSPATLYKLDTYWKMQSQLREQLQKLGDKQAVLFSKRFENQYRMIYRVAALTDNLGGFDAPNLDAAAQIIKQIWCADGSSWTDRIWKNTEQLMEALNNGLMECVINGTPTEELKHRLMDAFNVSYSKADNIVRTEMTHIQAQAAKQRYEDAGITKVRVWADKDERRCDICGKLHNQTFGINEKLPIPAHPRCRCRIIPVVEVEPLENEQLKLDGF